MWSLWEIRAKNGFEEKKKYQSYFIADNGKQYSAYANDIWNRLIDTDRSAKLSLHGSIESPDIKSMLNEYLFITYQNLEAKLKEQTKQKRTNKLKAFDYQRARIQRIGIPNIRFSKLKKLEKEYNSWETDFESNSTVIPGLQQIITIRING